MKRIIFSVLLFSLLIISPVYAKGEKITIFHAGSLSVPFKLWTKAYNKLYPNVTFYLEPSGSLRAIRKITELGKPADILASADSKMIRKMMFPNFATWYVEFATNQMVIAYRSDSPYADKITSHNWYKILTKKDVVYGHSDPNLDPCGYRTLIVWKLAEIYYDKPGIYKELVKHCPPKNIRPKAVDLIALLESKNMDYIFEYKSVAIQHHLKYLILPKEIDLSDPKFEDFYKKSCVEVIGNKPGTKITIYGEPITYGLTIPKCAKNKNGAEKFLNFILSSEGRKILKKTGQNPIDPPIFVGER